MFLVISSCPEFRPGGSRAFRLWATFILTSNFQQNRSRVKRVGFKGSDEKLFYEAVFVDAQDLLSTVRPKLTVEGPTVQYQVVLYQP